MCNNQNVPSVSLQSAVLLQVKEFVKNKQTFSVHDITRNIRSKASSGDLEIPEVEVSGASFRFDIPHTKVKSLFNDLWNTGVFDPEFTLNRSFNGTYWEYTPSPVSGNTAPQPGAYTASTTSAAVPAVTVQNVPTPTVPSVNIPNRIKTYLTNCKNRNVRPTIKQIQSAIKRDNDINSVRCEDLRSTIQSFGFTIIDDPKFVSRDQVVTT